MNDNSKPSRSTLGVKANTGQAPKDPGRKAVRPAGRKQAAGLAPKTPPRARSENPRGDRSEGQGDKPRSFKDRPPRKDFGDRPPRRDFGDRPPRQDGGFQDRPRRDFGDRPPRKDFGDRPPRREGEFNDRPRRDFGDRPPRQDAGFQDRPRRDFSDRPPRQDGGFQDRPRRDFGDRPPRQDGGFQDRPRRDFGDRPPRQDGGFQDRPRRDFGDRPPRQDGGFQDRPRRDFGDRPPRRDGDFQNRPRRDFGDRPPRQDGGFQDRPRRDFGDRPPRQDGGFQDRPRRDFGDRPPRQDGGFQDRPRRDFNDRPRHFEERPSAPVRQAITGVVKTDFPTADTAVLNLFLPCPAGVQDFLAQEIAHITGGAAQNLRTSRGGVAMQGDWATVQRLNLHSRLAQRVLIELAHAPYHQEVDLYETALTVAWEEWFSVYQTFKIDLTAQASPLQSLNFAALKIKDAVADRFREQTGARPNVETHFPDVRIQAHLTRDLLTLYIDSSGEPLFKRGWRQDKGDAPLKETLAAAILAASGWTPEMPLYDPCCGSGTIAIEAAQIAAGIAAGSQRSFGFEGLKPFDRAAWLAIKEEAAGAALAAQNAKNTAENPGKITIFGSDVAHRMVDFAERNAERAGVADWVEFRGGDALQRKAPIDQAGLIVLNPPYGERIETGGFAASDLDFFVQLASHWKNHFDGWTAWVLSPDFRLPGHMHLAESRKVPMWNGPIECRLFKFEMVGKEA